MSLDGSSFPRAVLNRNSICSCCRMAPDSSLAAGRGSSRITRTSCPRHRSKPELSSGVKNCWKGLRNSRPPLARRKRSEEHTSELQSLTNLVCRLLLEKKNKKKTKKSTQKHTILTRTE